MRGSIMFLRLMRAESYHSLSLYTFSRDVRLNLYAYVDYESICLDELEILLET